CGGVVESTQVTPLVPAFHYLIWAAEQDGAITVGCEDISHDGSLRYTLLLFPLSLCLCRSHLPYPSFPFLSSSLSFLVLLSCPSLSTPSPCFSPVSLLSSLLSSLPSPPSSPLLSTPLDSSPLLSSPLLS